MFFVGIEKRHLGQIGNVKVDTDGSGLTLHGHQGAAIHGRLFETPANAQYFNYGLNGFHGANGTNVVVFVRSFSMVANCVLQYHIVMCR